MKAISIRQPYAWCVSAGHKPVENRTWSTRYRGPILIHAALRPDAESIEGIERRYGVVIDRATLRYGGIVGRAELVDVVTAHTSPWFTGPYAFVLERATIVPFFKLRGAQGLFGVTDALDAVLLSEYLP